MYKLNQTPEELTQQLLRQRSSQPDFKLPLSYEDAAKLLFSAYRTEVIRRDRNPVLDDNVISAVKHLAQFLTSDSRKFGIMLCGTLGNGKSTLLAALQNAVNWLNQSNLTKLEGDFSKGFEIVDAATFTRMSADINVFNAYKLRHMLAIEDMGCDSEKILVYGSPVTPITDLIEFRYAQQLFTIVTTNLTATKLVEKYGNRLTDRFNEMEVIIFKNSKSYRKL